LFSGTNLGFDGAVLQMVAHGLVSTSLFLLAGTIERRTTTGQFALLGGMARGRPALATLLMTVGVISLAVPGSAAFAGEFLILAGAFQRAWWWAAIGAGAIVLAAMYMLRLISAVLHEARGSTVQDEALDLRAGELALLVPLVGVLLVLSAWPAGISHHSFAGDEPVTAVQSGFTNAASCSPGLAAELARKIALVTNDVAKRPSQTITISTKALKSSPLDVHPEEHC
jgi:NADH-quinone oxidoreductase subunit M